LLENLVSDYRKVVPRLENDRVLSVDINATVQFLKKINI